MSDCVFCRIVADEAPADVIFEDERTLAFLDIHPAGEGHTLVVPKAHAANVWDVLPEDWDALWGTARRLAVALRSGLHPDGLFVEQANGTLGGQEIMHLHIHLIPRYVAGRAPRITTRADVAAHIRRAL
jgi:histidine triad (HIT) family protein